VHAVYSRRALGDRVSPDRDSVFCPLILGPRSEASIDRGNLHSLSDPFAYSLRYRVPNAVAIPGPGAVSSNLALGEIASGSHVLGTLPPSRLTTFSCPSETIEETDKYVFPTTVQVTSMPKSADVTADGTQFHIHYEA